MTAPKNPHRERLEAMIRFAESPARSSTLFEVADVRWALAEIDRLSRNEPEREDKPGRCKKCHGYGNQGQRATCDYCGAPFVDLLHPRGRCTCFGEGRCAWCLENDRLDEPERDRLKELNDAVVSLAALMQDALSNTHARSADQWQKDIREAVANLPGAEKLRGAGGDE